jgi:hypothetical protein
MAANNVLHPTHPERICWGCNRYCPADDLRCGDEVVRAMHPAELFGDDWLEWTAARGHAGEDEEVPPG